MSNCDWFVKMGVEVADMDVTGCLLALAGMTCDAPFRYDKWIFSFGGEAGRTW